MLPIGAAAGCTTAHRNNIFRFRHLFIKPSDPSCHLECHRTRNDHEIGLPGCRARHTCAEPVKVVVRSGSRHKFNGTAGKPERHGPEGGGACPVGDGINRGDNNIFVQFLINYHNFLPSGRIGLPTAWIGSIPDLPLPRRMQARLIEWR